MSPISVETFNQHETALNQQINIININQSKITIQGKIQGGKAFIEEKNEFITLDLEPEEIKTETIDGQPVKFKGF